METGRQILHPGALRDPTQAIAQSDHGGEGDDDGGNPHPCDQHAVERAEQRAHERCER